VLLVNQASGAVQKSTAHLGCFGWGYFGLKP